MLRDAAVPAPATAPGRGGRETRPPRARPCFTLPGGGTLTFEPGGQLEYSSPAVPLAERAARGCCARWCCRSARRRRARGSRCSPSASIPPTRSRARRCCSGPSATQRMADYLARRGPGRRPDDAADGRVPGGARPGRRAVAPLAGAQRGGAVRGGDLRQLAGVRRRGDRLRERPGAGVARARSGADRPALERARSRSRPISTSRSAAPAILLADRRRRAPAVRRVAGSRRPSRWTEWHDHLTTLFPEVRPRGHFELRSADAVAPQWYAAPIALAVGITYEPARPPRRRRAARARRISGCSSARGGSGLRDPAIARDRRGPDADRARRLRRAWARPTSIRPDLEQARAFFDRYTRQGRAPGDDLTSSEVAA